MTTILTALLMVVGAVAVLNLLLTVGVIRRLRQHTERLSHLSAPGGAPEPVMLEAGAQVGEFAATTTDGEPVSRDLLSGQTLVGVFAPSCSACREQLPNFISKAETFPGGRAQVLAVVSGEPEQVGLYRDQLTPVARVVVESPPNGPLVSALQAVGFPAFAVLNAEGVVVASDFTLDSLPLLNPIAA